MIIDMLSALEIIYFAKNILMSSLWFFFSVAGLCFIMSILFLDEVTASVMQNRTFWVSLLHHPFTIEPTGPHSSLVVTRIFTWSLLRQTGGRNEKRWYRGRKGKHCYDKTRDEEATKKKEISCPIDNWSIEQGTKTCVWDLSLSTPHTGFPLWV